MRTYYGPVVTQPTKRGAGCMIMSSRTGRFLLCKRGPNAPYPGVWSIAGGKAERGETPEQTARRETDEETGYKPQGEIEHLYHFELSTFSFDTYVAIVDHEFAPKINGETEEAAWLTLEEIPDNVHDGLRAILEDRNTVNMLIRHVEKNSGRRCDFDRIYRRPVS